MILLYIPLVMDKEIYTSALYSLIIQFIIGIVCAGGLFIELDKEDRVLNEILLLESIVQFIEFSFYLWLIFNFSNITTNVTLIRYFDWFITTPTMLFSIISFMIYYGNKINNISNEFLSISSIYNSHTSIINNVIVLNAIMLLTGFLGELGKIGKSIGFIMGTICLSVSYYLIYSNFVNDIFINKTVFWFNFIIWSLYGVAYLMSYTNKNIFYNILDIFSKNINGLMIFALILYTKYSM